MKNCELRVARVMMTMVMISGAAAIISKYLRVVHLAENMWAAFATTVLRAFDFDSVRDEEVFKKYRVYRMGSCANFSAHSAKIFFAARQLRL